MKRKQAQGSSAWFVTYSEVGQEGLSGENKLSLTGEAAIQAPGRVELRDRDGNIVRLAKDAEFGFADTPQGRALLFYGELFVKGNLVILGGKYRTSCRMSALSTNVEVLCRPIQGQKADEFFAITGTLVITEFDSHNKEFIITTVPEGSKAVIAYDPSKPMEKRYKPRIQLISKAEYDYILNTYLDGRRCGLKGSDRSKSD